MQGDISTNRISPNGDGRMDQMAIAFDFSETVDWTFELRGKDASLLVLTGNGARFESSWDGTVDGVAVPDGSYGWQLSATDSDGNAMKAKSGRVMVDRQAPVLKQIRTRSKLDLSRKRPVPVTFRLLEAAKVVVTLIRDGKATTLASVQVKKPGSVTILWNGRLGSRKARPDVYQVQVTAVDLASNRSVARGGAIKVTR